MLAGLESGSCGEAWNLTHPDRVLAIQKRYAEAGAVPRPKRKAPMQHAAGRAPEIRNVLPSTPP